MQPMLNIALRAARRAGQIIVRALDRVDILQVEEKQRNDLVSEVDRAAEDAIIETLHRAYPDHAIVAEESGATGEGAYTWIIDPLDGTTNFLYGIPHFAVSIALRHRDRIEQAVVLDPLRNEEFIASRGVGAQLNGRRMRVSKRNHLELAVIGTGIPYRAVAQDLDAYTNILKDLTRTCRGVRRGGAAALDLAYVAAGRFDAYFEVGLKSWDIAAGALLIEEAGGIVSDLGGRSRHIEIGNVACGNPKCHRELLAHIEPYLTDHLRNG
jgi:myo-inositol-1(or 4)-monophosphatase